MGETNHDIMTLDVLNQFNFFSAVPLGGSATYGDIARTTTLPESIVRRILEHATTVRLFSEGPPGSDAVVHTATTAFLAKNPLVCSWVSHNLEELRPAALYFPESLRKFNAGREESSEEVVESAFSLADVDRTGHPTTFWDYLKHDPEGKPEGFRAKRFAEAMQTASLASAASRDDVVKLGFDWASLGEATVVDVSLSNSRPFPLAARASG
jgi:hypothetical protein